MGNTADLAMVQKTPSTKRESHRGSLLKDVAVQGVLYQSIINAKLTGRKKLGRKMCTSNKDDRKLENTSSKANSNTWESFTRSELKLESVHQESPRSDIFRKRATKPLLKQKHRQKNLTWAMEKNRWFNDHGVTVLDWPANLPDLNPTENLWGIVKRKMRYARPNNADDLKASIKATWASITPEQCHRLIAS